MTSRPARILAAVCLVLTALLSVVSVLLQPEFSADPAARLAVIRAAGTSATVSALTFALSQLPFLVAVVAIAVLAHRRAPRTAWTGGVLGVVGGFGHTVFAGIAMSYLALAADATHRATLSTVITRVEAGPAKLFMAMGLLGTVLGLVFLGVALFRSCAVERWIPVSLWAFVVLEFAFSGVATWASLVAGLVYLAAFTGIAITLVRTSGPAATPERPTAPVPSIEV
jgi:hypothetical protein